MDRRRRLLVVLSCVLALIFGACSPREEIKYKSGGSFNYPSNPIGDQGTFSVLGSSNPIFTSDANHTATQPEFAAGSLYVSSSASLTATRTLVLPLVQGETKLVYNATTGAQAIAVGGSTGTTVTVPNGTIAQVACPDGANYVGVAGGGSSSGGGIGPTGSAVIGPTNAIATGNTSTGIDCRSASVGVQIGNGASDGETKFFVIVRGTFSQSLQLTITETSSGQILSSTNGGAAQSSLVVQCVAGTIVELTWVSASSAWIAGG